ESREAARAVSSAARGPGWALLGCVMATTFHRPIAPRRRLLWAAVGDAHAEPGQFTLGLGGGGVVTLLNGLFQRRGPVQRPVGGFGRAFGHGDYSGVCVGTYPGLSRDLSRKNGQLSRWKWRKCLAGKGEKILCFLELVAPLSRVVAPLSRVVAARSQQL